MNVEEKVATLEALLARVQNNAGKPRILRPAGAIEPHGGAQLAAPEPAIVAPAAAKPVEKVAAAHDPIDLQLDKLLDEKAPEPIAAKIEKPVAAKIEKPVEAKIEKPPAAKVEKPAAAKVEAKVEKPVEAKAEKPVEAKIDLIDVWTEALQDAAPKVQPASPTVARAAEKGDDATAKVAPIAAQAITPAATKPVPVRPTTTPARPIAPRPAFGSKSEVTPSPSPTVAKVPEVVKAVEKIEPAITAPKPVEKAAPVVSAPKPVEKITPTVAAAKPVEKVADKVEKVVDASAADAEIRFDFDVAPPKPAETKAAEKPVETAIVAPPVKAPPIVDPPTLQVPPRAIDLADEDDPVTNDDETMLMHGSIPEPDGIVDETTSDDETMIALPKTGALAAKIAADLAEDEPTTEASSSDGEEATHVFAGRTSRPDAEPTAPVTLGPESASAQKVDELKVVVSPSVRAPITESVYSSTEETVRAVKITEAVPTPRPSDSGEATAPSRRYPKPENEELDVLPMNGGKRASGLMLGLVAAALIGAGVFLGLRNGWFESSNPKGVPTSPTSSGPAPSASTAAITTTTAPSATVAPITSAAVPLPTTSASAEPAASASTAPTASVAPTATASTAPTVAPTAVPVADGDGTNLPPNRGYVIINSAKPASVFLTGNFAGLTGNKLEVECGAKFLRLAAPAAERPATPDWTSDGRSISVVCRSITTVTFEASR
ncbi:MAG: hypothetical protein ABJE95_35815 [Byssovorax sp.]